MNEYQQFIASKHEYANHCGFEPSPLPGHLFDYQAHIVGWAIRKGRAAVFAECGLGKTIMELEIATQCAAHTGKPSLILAPLAVKSQTLAEAVVFGYDTANIDVINYDRLPEIDPSKYGAVLLDESSILKNMMGKTRNRIIDAFRQTQYRFAFTATPSPNDVLELGNHAEFLGVKTMKEMQAQWFVNDAADTGTWRMKGHAAKDFWRWLASWAVCIADPSDLGYDATRFVLPPLNMQAHHMPDSGPDFAKASLFAYGSASATEYNSRLRESMGHRMQCAAALANGNTEQWLMWVHHNSEAELLTSLIPGAVNVHGSMSEDEKAANLMAFANGQHRILVTKQKIAGMGMNFQNCSNQVFTALDFSFEQFYQAIRRSYRFGQTKPVNIHYFTLPEMQNTESAIAEKNKSFDEMRHEMRGAMAEHHGQATDTRFSDSELVQASGANWQMVNGDCVQVMRCVENGSVDFSIFSPPFTSLFVYSDRPEDMGNCRSKQEFFEHYSFVAQELMRATRPGRLCAMHVSNYPIFKWQEGKTGLYDFRGDCVRAMESAGWTFHAEVTIWKDPVVEMQRTKTQGLLYKQLRKDSTFSRVGIPDYLIVFRKVADGESEGAVPVDWKNYDNFPVELWQQYASPVWMDIQQTNVLNVKQARETNDERHVCPLQLGVIERALHLWSNPGDLVLSPFAGIGSEGYVSIQLGRRFMGIELKPSYYTQAVRNLMGAEDALKQASLF